MLQLDLLLKASPFLAGIVGLMLLLCPGAQAAQVKHLSKPCRAKNVLAGRVVTDRRSGREMLVLTSSNETEGVQLLFVDLENDTGELFVSPAGAGAWGLLEVPGDRLVISTHYTAPSWCST